VGLFAVVVAFLLVFLDWYVAPNKPGERKDLVLALAQILAGTALLWGLYLAWCTLQVNREGQITERFTQAINQLSKTDDKGNKLFEIRLGGIYTLERIARESEEDHWPIMEVLSAYVRQHARWLPDEGDQEDKEDAAVEQKSEEDSREESDPTEVPPPAPDIQAIMTVLRRRTRYYDHGEPQPLDLHGTDLSGVNLYKANLVEANFVGANLVEANLWGADLRGADLSGANLWGANLYKANLYKANLSGAYLGEADLRRADLSGANLWGATLGRALLVEANLVGAYLSGADLVEAYLWGADLRGVDLSGANLWGVNLEEANLEEANLVEADLGEADLRGANLREPPSLGNEYYGITHEQLKQAIGDENTKLPDHLKPAASWGVNTDEQIEGD
jgi:uncharacterized protein YjbI with pentapeptide repeats